MLHMMTSINNFIDDEFHVEYNPNYREIRGAFKSTAGGHHTITDIIIFILTPHSFIVGTLLVS
jgi:hypothetical protein